MSSCAEPRVAPERVDLATLLGPGDILMLGEQHGTNEVPAFVSELGAAIAGRGQEVLIALEMAVDNQLLVDEFLDSGGFQEDRYRLLEGSHWTAEDGRASEAMLKLLDDLRCLRSAGRTLAVHLIDSGAPDATEDDFARRRDALMARELLAASRAHPSSVTISLTGNVHASNARMIPAVDDPAYRPMGWLVRRDEPGAMSFNVVGPTGTAWTCTADGCGAHPSGRKKPALQSGAVKFPEVRGGFHGEVFLPTTTASRPARQKD